MVTSIVNYYQLLSTIVIHVDKLYELQKNIVRVMTSIQNRYSFN